MASLKLFTEKTNYQVQKAQIVASYNGVDLEVVEKDAKDVAAKSPTQRGPVLVTPTGNVSESNAIVRYLARLRPDGGLYGSSFTASAQVDMWVDFSNNDIEPARANWLAMALDEVEFNAVVYKEAKDDITSAMTVLNNQLRHNQFLVGNQPTAADITVAVALVDLYKNVFAPAYLQAFKNVTRWFENLLERSEIGDVIGKVLFATAEKQASKAKKAKGGKPEGKGKQKEADDEEETAPAKAAEVKKPASPPPAEKKAEAAPAAEEKKGGKKKGGEDKKAGGEEKKAGGNKKAAGGDDKKAGGEEAKGKGSKKGGEEKKAGGEEKKAAGGKGKKGAGEEKKAEGGAEEKKAGGDDKKAAGGKKKGGGEEKKAGGDDKKAGGKKKGGEGGKKAEEKKAAAAAPEKDESKMTNEELMASMEEGESKSKKPANPLDLLPKSSMSLDTVKKSFWSQKPYNPNFFEGFWKEFDAAGYSLYTISYQYDADNRIYFMTQNQLGGFIQRVDDLRKYGMGVLVLTGATEENPPWHVGGCWLFRGQDIPAEMKESGDADYYTWTKMDVTNAEHRKAVEAMFTASVVEGQTVLDRRYFK